MFSSMTRARIQAAWLKEQLARANLSGSEFARRAGIDTTYFSYLMQEGKTVGPKTREQITKALVEVMGHPVSWGHIFEVLEGEEDGA